MTGGTPVRVKICGLTTPADAQAAVDAGADWIGLNFHPGSPRRVDFERAAQIIAVLPPHVAAVGLFVDRPPSEVARVAAQLGLSIVQLHGQEPVEHLAMLRTLTVIRAFRLGDEHAIVQMERYLERAAQAGRSPDAVLIDADVAGLAGGTGRMIPNEILDRLRPLPNLILAGGLTPENVAERAARVHPWMVDVASGVESAPGRKDPARVAAFIRAVRGEARQPTA